MLWAEIQGPRGPLATSPRFSSRENDGNDWDWAKAWQVAVRAVLALIIKAVMDLHG
jgi:hypothetical protein